MRVNVDNAGDQYTFTLRLDSEDQLGGSGQQGMAIQLLTDTATVKLEKQAETVHPDLIALATLTIAAPWCRRRLILSTGVSEHFANVVGSALSIEVGPVEESFRPRSRGKRLGLMYSGGPDCMAAETLLGQKLPKFHFRRIKHPRVPNRTRMRSGTQEKLVRKAAGRGEEVHVARSDLEFLCRPYPTFPHWAALSSGAILSADTEDLGGIVTGRNISGIYLGWGGGFRPEGEQEDEWRHMFAAAGLDLIQPLAGASDIASKKIARGHRLHDLARSCMVGTLERPCFGCTKCLLTELMRSAIEEIPLDEDLNSSLASSAQVVSAFNRPPPYKNQHILAYSMARVPGIETTLLARAAQELAPTRADTAWVEQYFGSALSSHVPADLVGPIAKRIRQHVTFMSAREEAHVRGWNPRPEL